MMSISYGIGTNHSSEGLQFIPLSFLLYVVPEIVTNKNPEVNLM